MGDIKNSLKNSLLNSNGAEVTPKKEDAGEETPKKRRRGRPSVSHRETKLNAILNKRGMTRKDLYEAIAEKYPDEPISPDAVSRIVSGKRRYYSTTTLFRICGALNITPNMCLNWEEEVI